MSTPFTTTTATASTTIPGYRIDDLRAAAELAAGGPGKIAKGAALRVVITQAIERLCGYHNWNWMVGTDTLDTTDAQAFITLPTDFGHLLALDGTSTNRYSLCAVSMPQLLRMRAEQPSNHTVSVGQVFYYAIDAATQVTAAVPARWRLELYPTPTATEADAFAVSYRRRITLPAASGGESAVVDVPPHCSAALLACVRAEAALASPDDTASAKYPTYEGQAQQQLALLKERDAMMSPGGRLRGTTEVLRDADQTPGGRFYTETPVTIT